VNEYRCGTWHDLPVYHCPQCRYTTLRPAALAEHLKQHTPPAAPLSPILVVEGGRVMRANELQPLKEENP